MASSVKGIDSSTHKDDIGPGHRVGFGHAERQRSVIVSNGAVQVGQSILICGSGPLQTEVP